MQICVKGKGIVLLLVETNTLRDTSRPGTKTSKSETSVFTSKPCTLTEEPLLSYSARKGDSKAFLFDLYSRHLAWPRPSSTICACPILVTEAFLPKLAKFLVLPLKDPAGHSILILDVLPVERFKAKHGEQHSIR